MEPLTNENDNGTSSPTQKVLIGAGTLLAVILTLVAAVFLAMQDTPPDTPTEVVQNTPTMPPTSTIAIVDAPTATPTITTTLPVETPTTEPPPTEATDTPSPTATTLPPTATDTVAAPPPTNTPALPPDESPPTITPELPPGTAPETPIAPSDCSGTPANWISYQVQVGDTLNSLANRTSATPFELQQANCLESFTIRPGDIVFLPFEPPTPTPTNTVTPTGTPRPTPGPSVTPISPQIDRVSPGNVNANAATEDIPITVIGRFFRPREQGFSAQLRGNISIELILGEDRSSTSFDAIIPASQIVGGLPVGSYDLVVTNSTDRSGVRLDAFSVGDPPTPTTTPAPPVIFDLAPDEGYLADIQGGNQELTIIGSNFRPDENGFQVELQLGGDPRIELEVIDPATDTNITVRLAADRITSAGTYTLFITNPDDRQDFTTFRIFDGSRP